jgi:ATP-binding cassette subfamily A (ABC1) protein 3
VHSAGAGKTSTLNMLTGAVLPSSGAAWIGGHDILKEQAAVRRLIGYCPQHDALLDLLSVRE